MLDDTIQWLVVSDLDGTMLNHDSYDMAAAVAAVRMLQERGIPVILNTSKTYAETVSIRAAMDIHDAFIVENGSCLYLPKSDFERPDVATERDDYWSILLGETQDNIDRVLQHLGFEQGDAVRLSRCDVQQAVELTGLTEAQAEQAISREFSEPLMWLSDTDSLMSLQKQLQDAGFSTLQGGRFLHVVGDCDKGRAMQELMHCYAGRTKVIVLGDSDNDAAMLAIADISMMVSSPSNHQLASAITPDYVTTQPAPSGWYEAIDHALKQIDYNEVNNI